MKPRSSPALSVRRADRLRPVVTSVVVTLMMAGCASRSLNPPPVVDWSGGTPATIAPSTSVAAPQLYTVRRDDTLVSVAKRFAITPNELAALNNLGPNARLKPDQVIRVPAPVTSTATDANAAVATTQPVGNGSVEQRPLGSPADSGAPPGPVASTSNAPLKSGPLGVKRPYSDTALAELSRPEEGSTAVASTQPPSTITAAPPATALNWSWPASGKASAGFGDGKAKGIDIPGKAGDPVVAAADGKVTFSGTGVRGYGNFVIIRHSPDLLSVYAHNRTNLVKEGALVTKGQTIAEMGNSDSDAVKLHFEIRNDSKPVDPMKYLPAR